MNQTNQALDGVLTRIGIIRGLHVKAGSGLAISVDWGICRVGTVQDDAQITNKAALGYNQPGVKVELAPNAAAATMPANSTKLLWIKTDGTFALTADTSDGTYNDVSPDLGPNPFRGSMLPGALSDNDLRQRQAASLLMARVVSTTQTGTITLTGVFDNTESVTVTIDGGTPIVVASTVDATTAVNQAIAVKAAIDASPVEAAKVAVVRTGAVLVFSALTSSAYTLTTSDTAAAGASTASGLSTGHLSGATIGTIDNTIAPLSLV